MDAVGYVKVNDLLQTNYPFIYAAGDCALLKHKVLKTRVPNIKWDDAFEQGKAAVLNALGGVYVYEGIAPVIVSTIFGFRFAATHPWNGSSSKVITQEKPYERFTLGNKEELKDFAIIGNGVGTPLLLKIRRAYQQQKQVNKWYLNHLWWPF